MDKSNLSYVSSPLTREASKDTFYDRLLRWATKFPEKPAMVEYDAEIQRTAITYKKLLDSSLKVSTYLLSCGLQHGDLVGIYMSNSIAAAQVIFGVFIAGGRCFFIRPCKEDASEVIDNLKANSVEYICFDLNQAVQISDIVSAKDSGISLKATIAFSADPNASYPENVTSLNDVVNSEYDVTRTGDLSSDDISLYFQTSGSTGRPKAVGQTCFTLLNATDAVNDRFKLDENSVWFCDRHFSWGIGAVRTLAASGCTRVFMDSRLTLLGGNTEILCNVIEAERCTHLYLPRYLATDVLERPDLAHKFSTVVNINSSGERIPKRYSALLERHCRELCVWYGSQEAAGITCFSSPDPDMYEDGIIGQPFPGVSIKIVNDKGQTVARGERGEILIRTPYMFVEYRGMPEKYEATFDSDGWFRSGDIGHIRADGNLVIDGRTRDTVSLGTNKFFPQSVEREIARCPGVSGVVAVPVPDKRLQNVFCACVTMETEDEEAGIESVKVFCDSVWKGHHTGGNLNNKPFYYLFYKAFPVTSNGKTDKRTLTEDAKQRLGL